MKILAVSRIPLGGIRTFMRYVYSRMGNDVEVTLVACNGQENDALRKDVEAYGGRLVLCDDGALSLARAVRRELRNGRYDVLHSHGFLSAASASLGKMWISIPHVLTIHGVIEERRLTGFKGKVKRWILQWVVTHVDVVHGVGKDILAHVLEKIPPLARRGNAKEVVLTGVDTHWVASYQGDADKLRAELGLEGESYLFGFLGRFMPEKGLDLIIDALDDIKKEGGLGKVVVICCGSGDCIGRYRRQVADAGLEENFLFIPFRDDPRDILNLVDAVIMPSRWEAFGLLAAEALALGTPLIASTCIGLREAVRETPALTFPPEDRRALAEAMRRMMGENLRASFREYQATAIERYDVQRTADGMKRLFEELAAKRASR